MQINHKIIRGILKWGTFLLFAISVGIKIKAIIKYGGTKPNKDPNEAIKNEEGGPVPSDEYVDDVRDDDDLREVAEPDTEEKKYNSNESGIANSPYNN